MQKIPKRIIQLQFDIELRWNFLSVDESGREGQSNGAINYDPVAMHHYPAKHTPAPLGRSWLHRKLNANSGIKVLTIPNHVKMHSNSKSFNTDLKLEF